MFLLAWCFISPTLSIHYTGRRFSTQILLVCISHTVKCIKIRVQNKTTAKDEGGWDLIRSSAETSHGSTSSRLDSAQHPLHIASSRLKAGAGRRQA